MAARAQRIATGKGNDIVVLNQPSAAPVRRRRSPVRRAAKRTRRTVRRATKSYGKASLKTRMTSVAAGGFGVGFIEKNWGDQIPHLPFLGRKGTIAAAIYFMEPKTKLLQDVGVAAAAISGYELGLTGAISGDVMGVSDPYGIDGHGDWDDDDDDWDDDDDEDMMAPTT